MLVSELTMIFLGSWKKNIQKRNKKAHWHKMSGVNYIARRPIYAFLKEKWKKRRKTAVDIYLSKP